MIEYEDDWSNFTFPTIGGIRVNGTGLTQLNIFKVKADKELRNELAFRMVDAPNDYLFEYPEELQSLTIIFYGTIQTDVYVDLYGCMGSKWQFI